MTGRAWLVRGTTSRVRSRFQGEFAEVSARTGFESSTGACQQDIDKYGRISWLGVLDTYRTMCVAPGQDFLRVLEEIRRMRLAA
jgi:hypothetical protein